MPADNKSPYSELSKVIVNSYRDPATKAARVATLGVSSASKKDTSMRKAPNSLSRPKQQPEKLPVKKKELGIRFHPFKKRGDEEKKDARNALGNDVKLTPNTYQKINNYI